jgi:hypothetical protein
MKRLFLTAATLGLAGTMGIANAAPITSTSVTVWSANTPAPNNVSTSPLQPGPADGNDISASWQPCRAYPGVPEFRLCEYDRLP